MKKLFQPKFENSTSQIEFPEQILVGFAKIVKSETQNRLLGQVNSTILSYERFSDSPETRPVSYALYLLSLVGGIDYSYKLVEFIQNPINPYPLEVIFYSIQNKSVVKIDTPEQLKQHLESLFASHECGEIIGKIYQWQDSLTKESTDKA